MVQTNTRDAPNGVAVDSGVVDWQAWRKLMAAVILALAALQMVSSQASPPPVPPSNGGGERWGSVESLRPEVNLAYERQAQALRTEMHALQESDGGQLTPQHRAYMQEKAKALLSGYHRDVQRVDPMAINADGSKPH